MIFDTHAHYDDEQFDKDRDELLSSMAAGGVGTIVDAAATVESWDKIVELAEKYSFIYGSVGVHPDEVGALNEENFARMREVLKKEKIVAVGEIGLDYYWDKEGHDLQKHWFIRQLDLAREMNKPVMIHSREAAADTMEIMKEHGKGLKGVIHCYSYSLEMAREYVKMGYYIGVGGVVTFKNSKKLKEIVEEIPLESIVLETDCPYLAPTPFRGKRNSSLYLPYVVEAIAELKGIYINYKKWRDEMKEPTLGNPQNTIEVLQKYNFVFQKKFGQNFLIDTHVLDKIIAAAEITKDDFVLEIGPGIGTMTQYLACAARKVVAVEIDKALIPILEDTLSDYDNARVINNDVLKVDIAKLAEEENGGKPIKVVANLPYYITTPIIMGLFENHVPIKSITVMVQKEVADRMQVGPGTKDYGALSLAVQYYAKPYIVANVPPNCFMPRPKVGSAVIRLERYEEPPVKVKDEKLMFRIIRASFNQRRKTLANGLKNSAELDYTKEEIEAAIEALGRGASIRGEALTLEEFAKLADFLYDCR